MAVLQATIKAALDVLSTTMKEAPMSDSDYNNALAGIIRNAILSATVNSGIAVQVNTGTGTGATTSTGGLA